MALPCRGAAGQHVCRLNLRKDNGVPAQHTLQLDATGRFLAVPVPRAIGQAPEKTPLQRHLSSLERICGN